MPDAVWSFSHLCMTHYPYVSRATQERERALIWCIRRAGMMPVGDTRVLEVGCSGGANLIDLIRLGFRPHHLVGNKLREDRLAEARDRLPQTVTLLAGDASTRDLEEESFDIVLQSTVFTCDPGLSYRSAALPVLPGALPDHEHPPVPEDPRAVPDPQGRDAMMG